MKVSIFDFPFPPSSNNTRRSFFNQKSKRMTHYDTPVYKSYKAECAAWRLGEWKALKLLIPKLQALIQKPGGIISVDSYFAFHRSSIWTKDGRIKRVDTSNRIKAAHDELSKALRIDDQFFSVGRAERTWVPDGDKERVIFVLRAEALRPLTEIMPYLIN